MVLLGRQADVPIESPDQQLADLARPQWLFGLELDNQDLDLGRQLIGVAHQASGEWQGYRNESAGAVSCIKAGHVGRHRLAAIDVPALLAAFSIGGG